jgi:DnaJ family protein C protein 28
MDFKDWRQSAAQPDVEQARAPHGRLAGRRFSDHIEEQIRAAEERGAFRNLRGMGQPLTFDNNPYAGEKATGYSLLKNNGYAPAEIELARDIRQEQERLDALRRALMQRGRDLRQLRGASFISEKRAYNNALNKALVEYEARLRELNRKILTLNLSAPAPLHRSSLDVERLVSQFRELCPLL